MICNNNYHINHNVINDYTEDDSGSHPEVPVCGRFMTPSELWLYVVDGCVVARSKLLAFYEDGELSTENMAVILSDLRRLQRAQG